MNCGRPLAYDPDRALDTAMHVFWRHGYEAASLQVLLQAMGLSKSSFYQAFGGKKELFLRCVDRYGDKICTMMQSLMDSSESGLGFVEELLLSSASEAKRKEVRRGCLLMNTATEFAQKDPEVAARVTIAFDGLRGLLKSAILRGQQEEEITREEDAAVLAGYLLASLAGLKTVIKSGADEKKVQEIVKVVLRALK